jgi:hypothetical protein
MNYPIDCTINGVALANKLARIAWAVLAHGRSFEAAHVTVTAAAWSSMSAGGGSKMA